MIEAADGRAAAVEPPAPSALASSTPLPSPAVCEGGSIRSPLFLTNPDAPYVARIILHRLPRLPVPSTMAFVLGPNNHGKGRVRLLKVRTYVVRQ